MNTPPKQHPPGIIEQVESWLEIAQKLGYRVRYDHFGDGGGGVCEFGGQKWIFMDVSQASCEHLTLLEDAIPNDPLYGTLGSGALEQPSGPICSSSNVPQSKAA